MPEVYIDGVLYVPAEAAQKPPEASNRWEAALDALETTSPTGAWGKRRGGIAASRADVDYNRARLPGPWYMERVKQVAEIHNLPPWLLLGIFDRESNHGRALQNGYGDNGNGFGVGQVDRRYHTQLGKPDPYAVEHMGQCCDIFTDYLRQIEKKHPGWADKYVLKGAVVAYNSGVKNVATIQNMDKGTTGDDYGADTCARAQYWKGFI